MNTLINDVLYIIFSYVRVVDLLHLSMTCNKFRYLLYNKKFWQTYCDKKNYKQLPTRRKLKLKTLARVHEKVYHNSLFPFVIEQCGKSVICILRGFKHMLYPSLCKHKKMYASEYVIEGFAGSDLWVLTLTYEKLPYNIVLTIERLLRECLVD
jgi:hypothetical protein